MGAKVCASDGARTICDAQQGSPSAELCDRFDNDCDGEVDEGVPDCCTAGETRTCGLEVGACEQGTQTCSSQRVWGDCLDASGAPVRQLGQVSELCNALDDDCDGETDEDFAVGDSCHAGQGACLATGHMVCAGDSASTTCDAVALEPGSERCNGIDDDCDGATDEDFDLGAPCSAGQGICTTAGRKVCFDDGSTSCEALSAPQPGTEQCNGLDDDCDGMTDEDFATGQPCDGPDADGCERGLMICAADGASTICDADEPETPELCDNGVDDDCNGETDEPYACAP